MDESIMNGWIKGWVDGWIYVYIFSTESVGGEHTRDMQRDTHLPPFFPSCSGSAGTRWTGLSLLVSVTLTLIMAKRYTDTHSLSPAIISIVSAIMTAFYVYRIAIPIEPASKKK